MPSVLARTAEAANDLSKRLYNNYYDDCPYGTYYSNGYCYRSAWSTWGRWVLLGVILLVAFAVFLAISCLNARRRRKRGMQPITGTGWLAPPGHGQAQYTGNQSYPMNNNNNNNQYAPPTYAPPNTQHHGANESYYGQEGGVTQPANVYAPPAGPPPNKY